MNTPTQTTAPQSIPFPSLPSRGYYTHGGLRPITKAQAKAFNDAVRALLAPFPITETESEYSPHTVWTVPTEVGTLTVTLYDEQDTCFTVYTRFLGDPTPAACERFGREEMNHYSGKLNVHQSQADNALDQLDRYLRRAGAVPPGREW